MADGWVERAGVAVPPRSLAYGAGLAILALAVAAGALGFSTALRREVAPEIASAARTGATGEIAAKPIVEIAPPTPAAQAKDDADDDKANDAAKAQALAAQTAAAQALQAKGSGKGDIDDIMASPTEKPPAPVKNPGEEAPPATAPVKSDVPY
jgi:hypothetical protein